jgi:hypothetical protein
MMEKFEAFANGTLALSMKMLVNKGVVKVQIVGI